MPVAGYKKTKCTGVLAPERLYTKEGALKAAAIGPELMFRAVESGIVKPIRCGVRVYYCGDELIAWIKSHRAK